MTADKIKELIGSIHGVSLIEDFIIDEAGSLKGRIAVVTDQEHADLEWYVEISPTYPFKTMGMEPIHFQNKNLLDYPLAPTQTDFHFYYYLDHLLRYLK